MKAFKKRIFILLSIMVPIFIMIESNCFAGAEEFVAKKIGEKILKKSFIPVTILSTANDAVGAYKDTHEENDSFLESSGKVTKKVIKDEIDGYKEIAEGSYQIYKEKIEPEAVKQISEAKNGAVSAWKASQPVLKNGWEKTKEGAATAKEKVADTWNKSKPILKNGWDKSKREAREAAINAWDKSESYWKRLKKRFSD